MRLTKKNSVVVYAHERNVGTFSLKTYFPQTVSRSAAIEEQVVQVFARMRAIWMDQEQLLIFRCECATSDHWLESSVGQASNLLKLKNDSLVDCAYWALAVEMTVAKMVEWQNIVKAAIPPSDNRPDVQITLDYFWPNAPVSSQDAKAENVSKLASSPTPI